MSVLNALEVSAGKLIAAAVEELKKVPEVKKPEWVSLVKSGAHAERVPDQEDFWFIRCASLLRTLYLGGGTGVRRLRHKYGGKRGHTVSRSHHTLAGGKTIRLALQQLEKAGLVKKIEKGKDAGRTISEKGIALLDKAAKSVSG